MPTVADVQNAVQHVPAVHCSLYVGRRRQTQLPNCTEDKLEFKPGFARKSKHFQNASTWTIRIHMHSLTHLQGAPSPVTARTDQGLPENVPARPAAPALQMNNWEPTNGRCTSKFIYTLYTTTARQTNRVIHTNSKRQVRRTVLASGQYHEAGPLRSTK